jgi:peptide deformylase
LALLALRFEGDPVLLEIAVPVDRFDAKLADLVRDMFETMYAAPGRGLAAPQVGISRRVFVVDTTWKEADPQPMVFVNPEITAQSEEMRSGVEGCLSIPDKSFDVMRPAWVDMTWQDLGGVRQTGHFEGIQSICVCHELDHLNGVLITQTGALI